MKNRLTILLFASFLSLTGAPENDWRLLATGPLPPNLIDICEVGDEAWLLDSARGLILRSRDGKHWIREHIQLKEGSDSQTSKNGWRMKALGNRTFIIGGEMTILRAKTSGMWERCDVSSSNLSSLYSMNDMDTNGSQLIAVGGKVLQQGGSSVIMASNDGQTWSGVYDEYPLRLNSVRWTANRWLVAGGHFETGGWVFTSVDGRSWDREYVGQVELRDCLEFKGTEVAVAGSIDGLVGAIYMKTADGQWKEVFASLHDEENLDGEFGRINSLVVYNGWVYASGRGAVYRSFDGAKWERALTLQGAGELYNLRLIGGSLYAVGRPGLLFKTEDGQQWNDLNLSNRTRWSQNSLPTFLLPSWSGQLLASGDGESWYVFTPMADNSRWRQVVKTDEAFFLLSQGNGKVYAVSSLEESKLVYDPPTRFEGATELKMIDGSVYAVMASALMKISRGEQGNWRTERIATSLPLASIAGSEDRLVGIRDNEVYRINPKTGELSLSLRLPASERAAGIGYVGPRVVVCSVDGTGECWLRWSDDLSRWSAGFPSPGYMRDFLSNAPQLRATDGESIWISLDGVNWVAEAKTDANSLTLTSQSGEIFAFSPNDNYLMRKGIRAGMANASALVYAKPKSSFIVGCVSNSASSVLVRATTSELKNFGVWNTLGVRPKLTVLDSQSRVVTGLLESETAQAYNQRLLEFSLRVGAFPAPLLRAGLDADIIGSDGNSLTLVVENTSDLSGYVLIEMYSDKPVITNASIRLKLDRETPPPTFGIITPGADPHCFLFRLTGESLMQFGLQQTASRTSMQIFQDDTSIGVLSHSGDVIYDNIENHAGAFRTIDGTNEPKLAFPFSSGPCTILLRSESPGYVLFEAYVIAP